MRGGKPEIAEADLHAYADGTLPAARKAVVEAHLERHHEDAARVADWRAQTGLLHETFDPVLAEPVPLRLSPFRLAGRRAPRARPRLLAVASLAFAAGLGSGALMMLGMLSLDRRPVPATLSGTDALASRALAAHRTFTPEKIHPVEVPASKEKHLVEWLSKKLNYKLALPDLGEEGFSLLGGRLLSDQDGPAALFMFQNAKGERLTLYCAARTGKDQETPPLYTEHSGNAVFYWIDRHAAYALSGPADRPKLERITKRVFQTFESDRDS